MANVKSKKKKKDSGRTSITFIATVTGILVSLVVCNIFYTMATGMHLRSGTNVSAQRTKISQKTTTANRGSILDRNLDVIAQDVETYTLTAVISPTRENAAGHDVYVKDIKGAAEKLAPILGADVSKIEEILSGAKEKNLYQTEFGIYGQELTKEKKTQIEALKIGGLEFSKSTSRVYPTGNFASQLIGYTTKNEKQISVGQLGLEQFYNKELTGKNGVTEYQIGSAGNVLPNSEKVISAPVDGANVVTTLSKDVQQVTERAVRETYESNNAEMAFAIVMEVKTGKVLAQVGYPSYDMNNLDSITNYWNYPSQYAFEPGSVMKPFFYAAAMDTGVYKGSDTFQSGTALMGLVNGYASRVYDGSAAVYGPVKDAMDNNWGTITFDEGLVRSSNTGMVTLMSSYLNQDVGIEYLDKFGFGKNVGMIGLPEGQEATGSIDASGEFDQLKKINMSFGQGMTATPYQIVQAGSALFNGGKMMKPYVVDKVVDSSSNKVLYQAQPEVAGTPIKAETATQIQGLMRRVVDEPYGTGHSYKMDDITLLAKTGTGQIAGQHGYEDGKYTSTVLAAAPAEDPKVMIYYGFISSNYINFDREYFKEIARESLEAVNGYTAIDNAENINNENGGNVKEYTMPELVNHSNEYVKQKLDGYDLRVNFIGDGQNVLAQFPLANTSIISKQNIFLLTDGSNITMPDMTNWSRRDILVFQELTGTKVTINGSGKAVSQTVAPGTVIDINTEVTIELK